MSNLKIAALPLALCLAVASFAHADDAPTPPASAEAQPAQPGEAHNMMGHSPGSKEHIMMKDKTVPIHHTGDAVPPSGTPGEAHNMMGHSPADGKSMSQMKDKEIPIHHTGDALPPSNAPAEDHMMMDHSPADAKAMRKMKDKKIPIHHSEGSSAEGTTPAPQK